ncbi:MULTISPECIES: SDR family oxidoreductase [Actinomadura]|nr:MULTISPECIES: SDR family oxidoreductase [Actinomadura]
MTRDPKEAMDKPLVVITGAGSGIGAATARAFSREGHPLLLLGRRLDRLEALGLPRALCRAADVVDGAAVAAAVKEAEAAYGPVDALVNSAAVLQPGVAAAQSREHWERMVDVNVKGVLGCVQAVLPGMIERGGGTVVTIGSIAAYKTAGVEAVYSATKSAAHILSEGIRQQAAPHGTRVVTVAPGYVATGMGDLIADDVLRAEHAGSQEAAGGGLAAEDVAETVLFVYRQPQNVCVREVVLASTAQVV